MRRKAPEIFYILQQDIKTLTSIRDSLQKELDPLIDSLSEEGTLSILSQSLDVLEQIPLLINEVSYCAESGIKSRTEKTRRKEELI